MRKIQGKSLRGRWTVRHGLNKTGDDSMDEKKYEITDDEAMKFIDFVEER